MSYQNYIFDLYGTLVDIKTNENKTSLWKSLSFWYCMKGAEYSPIELKKNFRKKIKENENKMKCCFREIQIEMVFKALYEDKGIAITKREVYETGMLFRALSLEYIKLFKGAKEVLIELQKRKKKMFLLSNAQNIFTEPEIHMLQIYPYFEGILLSSDAGVKKPSEQFYEQLFTKYKLSKSESVMVGNDSNADIWGAADYGIDSRYIHSKQSPEVVKTFPENCIQINSLDQLLL